MQAFISQQFSHQKSDVLVERMSQLGSENVEMRLYETLTPAFNVELAFDTPVIALMLKGEKVVRMTRQGSFRYEPGESLIIPSGSELSIDFPSATIENPTQCLALVPNPEVIEQAIFDYKHLANEDVSAYHSSFADLSDNLLYRDVHIMRNMEYLIHLLGEENEHKELFINRASRELIVRILQSSAKRTFLRYFKNSSRLGFSYLAEYIKENVEKNFRIEDLAEMVCMSKSTFYQQFKNTFGITPNQFILNTKMEAAMERLKHEAGMSISQIGFSLGYSDCSYFTKQFKSMVGTTPKKYRDRVLFEEQI